MAIFTSMVTHLSPCWEKEKTQVSQQDVEEQGFERCDRGKDRTCDQLIKSELIGMSLI